MSASRQSQTAGAGLCSAQQVGTILQRVEPDAGDPFPNQPGVLPGAKSAIAPRQQKLAWFPSGHTQVLIYSLARLLGYLELNRPAGLLLPHDRPVKRIAIGRHIIDADSNHIASAQLAIDRQVEQGQVAPAALKLKFGPE